MTRLARARLMMNYKRDVSEHPWFNRAWKLVTPGDWNVRSAAASLALDGYSAKWPRRTRRSPRAGR